MSERACLILAAVILLLVAACTVPGPDDYEAALEQQRLYNEMVCNEHWPPYQGPADCSGNDGEKD